MQVFDTSLGTVHLVVGGGGAGSTIGETIDAETGFTQAHPFASSNGNNVQALEDAPWLGFYDTVNAYGYGVFDVDPGDRPGETSITFQWFSVPPTGSPLPTTPVEKFTFTRRTQKIQAGEPRSSAAPRSATRSPPTRALVPEVGPAQLPVAARRPADRRGHLLDVHAHRGRSRSAAAGSGHRHDPRQRDRHRHLGERRRRRRAARTAARDDERQARCRRLAGRGGVAPLALGATRKFQWLRDGEPIGGATDSTYDPLDSDVGHLLEVQVTESVDGYDPVSVTSAPQAGVGRWHGAHGPDAHAGADRRGRGPGRDRRRGRRPPVAARRGRDRRRRVRLLHPGPGRRRQAASAEAQPSDGESVISAPQTVAAAAFKTASRPGFRGTPVVGGTLSRDRRTVVPEPDAQLPVAAGRGGRSTVPPRTRWSCPADLRRQGGRPSR